MALDKASKLKNTAAQQFDDQPTTAEAGFNAMIGSPVLGTKLPQNVVARPIGIDNIYPDPSQPRRAMPSIIRRMWDGLPSSIPDLLVIWAEEAAKETGKDFPLEHILATAPTEEELNAEEEEDTETIRSQQYPITHSLTKLTRLAASILHRGLTNPITVVSKGPQHIIDTGERRWLAHYLLYTYTNHDKTWATIAARSYDKPNRWRQAEENSARENLNAIAQSRQLALLLIDLLDPDNQIFNPYESLVTHNACDRIFYAQVADGDIYRIPRGKSPLLLAATGLGDPVQLRMYRALLRLPDTVWMLADDYDIPERILRPLTSVSEDEATEQIQNIVKKRGFVDDTVTLVTVFDPTTETTEQEPTSSFTNKPGSRPPKQTVFTVEWVDRQLTKIDKQMSKTDHETRGQIIDKLEHQLKVLKEKYM